MFELLAIFVFYLFYIFLAQGSYPFSAKSLPSSLTEVLDSVASCKSIDLLNSSADGNLFSTTVGITQIPYLLYLSLQLLRASAEELSSLSDIGTKQNHGELEEKKNILK